MMALQVIGAGLPRTGTLSLKLALEQLGFSRCYHMTELLLHPEHAPLWTEAADGRPDWDRLFADYAATTDVPGCIFWRELSDHYPQARVILSMRDPDSWLESVRQTIGQQAHNAELRASPIAPVMEILARGGPMSLDRDAMIARFEAHVDAVTRTIAPERLLVFRAKDGWEPLCAFLGVPVPDGPYPDVNAREDARRLVDDGGQAMSFADLQAKAREMIRPVD